MQGDYHNMVVCISRIIWGVHTGHGTVAFGKGHVGRADERGGGGGGMSSASVDHSL